MRVNRSIRSKLITLYVGILTVVFVCFGVYIYLGFRAYLIRSLSQTLTWRAEQIATTFLPEIPARGARVVSDEIQTRYSPELNQRVIRITDQRGNVIYGSRNSGALAASYSDQRGNSPALSQATLANGERLQVISLRRRTADGLSYLIQVAAPTAEITADLRGLLMTLILGFPFLIGLAVGAGYILLGRALQPVDEIVGAAEAITLENLKQRLPISRTGDEVERLSSALNRMIARLDESFQSTARFAADASHELRTPLTIMRGELETLVKEPNLDPEVAERLGNVLEEAERLTRIIEGLLFVSRLETGEAQMRKAVFDLGEMIEGISDQLGPLAEDKLLVMLREITPGVLVEGDQIRLQQVGVNLIDNAFKYTPQGGQVSIKVWSEGDLAFFSVSDSGMGISERALPHIFDRFYRAEQARTRKTPGTGLGLSIVHSIVEAHQGRVAVESREGFGSEFRVELPLVKTRAKNAVERSGMHV